MARARGALAAAGLLLGSALCAGAGAQSLLSPLSASEYAAMRAASGAAAPMLAACSSEVNLAPLAAAIKAGSKVTVFVSGDAISRDGPLRRLLLARPDLVEIGSLGSSCAGKREALRDVVADDGEGRPETPAKIELMRSLAKSVVEGSAAIERVSGRKPRFFAFGKDFDHSAGDPFVQARLLGGIARYLDRPSPAARYDALAVGKAGFAARVQLARMEDSSRARGAGAYGQESIEQALRKADARRWSKKASEAWIPHKRAPLAVEVKRGR